jgi:hypothetical protein
MNILDAMATWRPEFVHVFHECVCRLCMKHCCGAKVDNYRLVNGRKQCNYTWYIFCKIGIYWCKL